MAQSRKAYRAKMRDKHGPDWWKSKDTSKGRPKSATEERKLARAARKKRRDYLIKAGRWQEGAPASGQPVIYGEKTSEADWKRGDVSYQGQSNLYYARRVTGKGWKIGNETEWGGGEDWEWVKTKAQARKAFAQWTGGRGIPSRRDVVARAVAIGKRKNPRRRTNKKQRFPKTMTLPGGVKLVRIDTSFGPMIYYKKRKSRPGFDPDYKSVVGVWIEQIAPGKYRVGTVKNGVVSDATPASPFKIERRGGLTAAQAMARVKAHFGKPQRRR